MIGDILVVVHECGAHVLACVCVCVRVCACVCARARRYDMYHQRLEVDTEGICVLRVEGLSENRPALGIGDRVRIRQSQFAPQHASTATRQPSANNGSAGAGGGAGAGGDRGGDSDGDSDGSHSAAAIRLPVETVGIVVAVGSGRRRDQVTLQLPTATRVQHCVVCVARTRPPASSADGSAAQGEPRSTGVDLFASVCKSVAASMSAPVRAKDDVLDGVACASVAFLPCRHMVACLECARRLMLCPLCRAPVLDIAQDAASLVASHTKWLAATHQHGSLSSMPLCTQTCPPLLLTPALYVPQSASPLTERVSASCIERWPRWRRT